MSSILIPSDVSVTHANKASSWTSDTATTYVLRLTPTIATVGVPENTVTIDVAAGGATWMRLTMATRRRRKQASCVDKEQSYGFINKWCSIGIG